MIVRIPRAAAAASGDGSGADLSTALRSLGLGGTLAKTAGGLTGNSDLGTIGTGLSGLVGLSRGISQGDPGQSIGGAANLGSGLASLAGYPGVSSALGAVGGPLTFATGLASGDPVSSVLGGAQTASMASGYLGGPTISSLAAPALEAGYMALPGATAEGLAGLGIGGGIGLGASAALAPIALMVMGGLSAATGNGDLFDSIFGDNTGQAAKQGREFARYASDFPGLAARRTAGAALFDDLDTFDTPDEIRGALTTASSGRSANVEPAAWNLSHRPSTGGIEPLKLDAWNAAAPGLAGQNWGAFQSLMDKGEAAGLDPGGLTGDWNLGDTYGGPGSNTTGEGYRTKLATGVPFGVAEHYDPASESFTSMGTWDPVQQGFVEKPYAQTQEAQDFGNAVAGVGQGLGIDWKTAHPAGVTEETNPGAPEGYRYGDYGNFDAEQLEGYNYRPGNYGPATLDYLRNFDPGVTEHADWGKYTAALDPGNTLAGLESLTLTPRKRQPLMATPFQWGGNDSPGGE